MKEYFEQKRKNLVRFLKSKKGAGEIISFLIILAVVATIAVAVFPGLKEKIFGTNKASIGSLDKVISNEAITGTGDTSEGH